jgi:1-acyl-sn-glycerol-3-phosphate acyltransferase
VRGTTPEVGNDAPVLVCLNHPSWWDPLVALALADATFGDRVHYAPIDATALARYRLFERIGFYGIESDSWSGAATFLRTGNAILANSRSVLWITAQGRFTDVRTRPPELRPGIGHLIHAAGSVTVVPLALEYTFWEERTPEVLACWGSPVRIASGRTLSAEAWTRDIAGRLEQAMDRLAELAKTRDRSAFEAVLTGKAGVGGVYDVFRRVRALLRREPFIRQHGSEGF